MRTSIAAILIPASLTLTSACCEVSSVCTPSTTPAFAVSIHVPSRAEPISVPGVVSIDLDFASGSDYRSETVTVSDGSTRAVTKVNGETFEVVGDELHIGARRYGPLAAGQVVRVTGDAVYLDGQRLDPR